MAVTNHSTRVFYAVVPKVACTSIKTMFWELDTGRDASARPLAQKLREKLTGRSESLAIHHVDGYVTRKFTRRGPVPEGYARICVIRDPLDRLRSAWNNKVGARIFAQRGETEDVLNEDLDLEPSFGFYLEHLERYRLVSRPSRVHTENFAWHIGPDLGWYDRVFRLEQIAELEDYLSERAGRPVHVPIRNKGGGAPRPLDLEPRHIEIARRLLAEDYALLRDYYDFDRAAEALRARAALTA